jgi:hypothetical protein
MAKPQLPITTVVTPSDVDGMANGSHVRKASWRVWTSTRPGASTGPAASSRADDGPRPRPSRRR